jgi:hypothetical protein
MKKKIQGGGGERELHELTWSNPKKTIYCFDTILK